MDTNRSQIAYTEAKKVIPGGVNSPVRAFKSVGGDPIFIARAKGSKVYDIDNNEYIDYVGSWGPMILGHSHPDVTNAIKKTCDSGTSFGAPTLIETQMARLICKMMPNIESVRMVNSGTEATMSALRLARGYTKRDLVVKFEGCYHGHGDSFLIKAGSGALTLGTPNSPGVTKGTAADTLMAQFNDINSVMQLFDQHKNEIAAVIVEPVTGNMGVVKPNIDFIKGLRKVCTDNGALLIFDEVMTGFRVARGGAQELLGVKPDITCLAKIIGGGLPVGAYGGSKEIMDHLAPNGPVYQAGTLSGNPLAMNAGFATLNILNSEKNIYIELEEKAKYLCDGLQQNIDSTGVNATINRVGSMFTLFFGDQKEINNFSDVMKSNTETYAKYFKLCLEAGIYIAPSQFEASFVSLAHTKADLDATIKANKEALLKL